MSFSVPVLNTLSATLSSTSLDIQSLLSDLSSFGASQNARLIQLDGAPSPVVVERFSGAEGYNQQFTFEVDLLSHEAALLDRDWLGREVGLSVFNAQGEPITRFGNVTALTVLGSDGGFNRFRIRLQPWAAWLNTRLDCWVYQDKTVLDIVEDLLADYPMANWKHTVKEDLSTHSLKIQYQESDWTFLLRILADEGLSLFFEAATGEANAQSRCVLHIVDRHYTPEPNPESPVRFGRISAALSDDRLTKLEADAFASSNQVALSSWDYTELQARAGEAQGQLPRGAQPDLQDYDGAGAYRFKDEAQATLSAENYLAAHEARSRQYVAGGALRSAHIGQSLVVIEHPAAPEQSFHVIAIEHAGVNNLRARIGDQNETDNGSYRSQLRLLPKEIPFVPLPSAKPSALTQSAVVVGTDGSHLHSDREHRIKVQFPWQRQDHPSGQGNAPGDAGAFTWVRLAEWLAGPNYGSSFTPRVGDEVLIDFIENDIDRPLIVGSLYSEQDLPPYSAGEEANSNHAGALSGFHSQNLSGEGHNRWAHDDSAGQLRTELQSTALGSAVTLGHTIRQGAHTSQRGNYRGTGFELTTEGWGVLRANTGVLLSARNSNDTQLEDQAIRQQLKSSSTYSQMLGNTLSTHKSPALNAQKQAEGLANQLDAEKGKINGQDAKKPTDASGRTLKDGVEKFNRPLVVLDTPSTLLQSTPASAQLYAGESIQSTSQGELHAVASHTLSLTAGGTASVFTHHGGMTLIAANEMVTIGAHTDALQLVSEQGLTITSTESEIQVFAQDSVTLFGGGAAVELQGANVTFKASGTFTVKAASTAFSGGGSNAASLAPLPDTQVKFFDEAFVLKSKTTGEPMANQAYQVKRADGSIETGVTDDQGHTHLVKASEAGSVQLEVLKAGGDEGEPVGNNAITLLAGPGGSDRRPSDPVEWYITPFGKSKNLTFANRATGKDNFYTVGVHPQYLNQMKVNGPEVEFFSETDCNCFAYSLGIRTQGMISFLGLGGEDIFIPARVEPLMLAIGGYLGEKSTGNSKEKRKYILPFDQKPPSDMLALDLWQGVSGYTWLWHVTRRVWVNGQTLFISKDGGEKPVENFMLSDISKEFITNLDNSFNTKPAFTMLIPISSAGNWPLLLKAIKGSH